MGDAENVIITLDLPRLGELIAAVATRLVQLRDLEPIDWDDESAEGEGRQLALAGWHHCLFMADRRAFAESVGSDLAALEKIPEAKPGPTHLPEFGGIAKPFGWNPPV